MTASFRLARRIESDLGFRLTRFTAVPLQNRSKRERPEAEVDQHARDIVRRDEAGGKFVELDFKVLE